MLKAGSKRRSSSLVEGHLERISSRAFDAYSEQITRLMSRRHGVYALYKGNRLYYVGLATDLRNRIKHHLRDRHAKRWDRFSLYLVGKSDHLKELETLMVRMASPRGNIQAGKLPGSRHMVRELERLVREHERRQRDRLLYGERRSEIAWSTSGRLRSASKRKTDAKGADKVFPLRRLLMAGSLQRHQRLRAVYKGRIHSAWVRPSGRIYVKGKGPFSTPTAAAVSVAKRPVNGWWFWQFRNERGEWERLKALQK